MEILLEVKNLSTHFFTRAGRVKAVDDVSLSIGIAETVGVVGESGCGKSVTALSILRLIPSPPGKIVGGEILFEGENTLELPEKVMNQIRGNHISMIFQEPMTYLNPAFTIGDQIAESLIVHQGMKRNKALGRAIEILREVEIPTPEKCVYEYPHQLSGGMRQRAMIAMALVCHPKLLIADEPTTALDVTIQSQILNILDKLKVERGMALLLITHNMGVVAEIARRVIVMYAGKVVESASREDLFLRPSHPYTRGLLRSIPRLGSKSQGRYQPLQEIPGMVPSPFQFPSGCAFHPRCLEAMDICKKEVPKLHTIGPGWECRCHLA